MAVACSSNDSKVSPSPDRHRHPHAQHSVAYSQLSQVGPDMTATQKLQRLNLETCPGHEWSRPRKRVSPKRSIETYHSHCGMCGIRRSRRSIEALKEAGIRCSGAVRSLPGAAPRASTVSGADQGQNRATLHISQVEVRAIDVPTKFENFDDYWKPFLGGQVRRRVTPLHSTTPDGTPCASAFVLRCEWQPTLRSNLVRARGWCAGAAAEVSSPSQHRVSEALRYWTITCPSIHGWGLQL
jgi:hypothetical protein